MSAFGKRHYTIPVIGKHDSDISKDWYVFFCFKHEGKVYKFKRREGINRIKDVSERLKALHALYNDLSYDLRKGWNPLLDPKRELSYNPIPKPKPEKSSVPPKLKKLRRMTRAELKQHFHNKGITY